MSFRLIQLLLISFLCALSSCVKVIDLNPPNYEAQNTLNCLLHPDSLISVTLTKSIPINTVNKPLSITNGQVSCYEDGMLLGQLAWQGQGRYVLNYKPQPNRRYRLEASIPGEPILSGEDYVPALPQITGSLTGPNSQNINSNPDILLSIVGGNTTKSAIWFSAYLNIVPLGQNRLQNQLQTVESNSPLLDTFNSTKSGTSIKRSWSFYIRIKPDLLVNNTQLVCNTLNSIEQVDQPNESFFMQFILGSDQFDQYLKTYITAFNNRMTANDGSLNNPFAEPSPVYSNVKNGLGAVIGYNTKTITLLEGKH